MTTSFCFTSENSAEQVYSVSHNKSRGGEPEQPRESKEATGRCSRDWGRRGKASPHTDACSQREVKRITKAQEIPPGETSEMVFEKGQYHTPEASSVVLCPVLGSPVQER